MWVDMEMLSCGVEDNTRAILGIAILWQCAPFCNQDVIPPQFLRD